MDRAGIHDLLRAREVRIGTARMASRNPIEQDGRDGRTPGGPGPARGNRSSRAPLEDFDQPLILGSEDSCKFIDEIKMEFILATSFIQRANLVLCHFWV